MQRQLSSADLRDLHQILESAGVQDFYSQLTQRGFGFAAWAIENANYGEACGTSPVDFLRSTVLPGICSPIFQILGKTQIDKMRTDLAKAYFRALQRIARHPIDPRSDTRSDAKIDRDVNAREVSVLYREALERNGLSIENWNLHFPFAILRRLGGENAAEIYWDFLRDTPLRSPHIGVLANLATVAFMYKQTMSTDTKVRQWASSWLSRNPGMENQDTIETRFNWSLDAARHADHHGLVPFLEVLDLEGHDIPMEDQGKQTPIPPQADRSADHERISAMDDWETELESAYVYRALMARLTGTRE
jgi:hypothetical protein